MDINKYSIYLFIFIETINTHLVQFLNSFAHPNSPTLIKLKSTQLLVGLNGYQPNKTEWTE